MAKPGAKSSPNLIIAKGERGLIVGQTGSGKTGFACWLLARIPQGPILIYDTKEEPKFQALPSSIVVSDFDHAAEIIAGGEHDFIIFRPPVELIGNPTELDDLLWRHYNELRHVDCYIDECYTFHNNGRAGKGLIALLTRGRSRGITTIISTQRPAYLSRFCITEAQKLYVLRLVDKADKKRLGDVIPDFAELSDPPKFGFWFYETGNDKPVKYLPVKLDADLSTGYTDAVDSVTDGDPVQEEIAPRHVWI